MKLNYKLIALTLLSTAPLIADTSVAQVDKKGPGIGIQAGMNFETATTPAQVSSNTYTGITIGANVEIPILSIFSIQPELNYSRRGMNLVDAGGVKADVNFHSLELPVLAKLTFLEGSIRPYVFAGPMGVWNISRQITGTVGGAAATASFDPKSFDLAGVAGVGVELGALFVNARYVLGFTDIDSNSADYRSRGFKLLAGLKF